MLLPNERATLSNLFQIDPLVEAQQQQLSDECVIQTNLKMLKVEFFLAQSDDEGVQINMCRRFFMLTPLFYNY